MATSRQEREAREARDRLKAYTARQEVHGMQQRRRLRDNVWAIVGIIVVAALATFTQIVYFTCGSGRPRPGPVRLRDAGRRHRTSAHRIRPSPRAASGTAP